MSLYYLWGTHELVFNNKFFAYNDLQLKHVFWIGITDNQLPSAEITAIMYYRANNGGNFGALMTYSHKI